MAGLTIHPRAAAVRHKGTPDYALAARLVEELPVPVIVSGGMAGAEHVRGRVRVHGLRGGHARARRAGQPVAVRAGPRDASREPSRDEILAEWEWVIDRAVEHLGPERAARYLRTFHPWYVDRAGAGREVQHALQRAGTVAEQRAVIAGLAPLLAA